MYSFTHSILGSMKELFTDDNYVKRLNELRGNAREQNKEILSVIDRLDSLVNQTMDQVSCLSSFDSLFLSLSSSFFFFLLSSYLILNCSVLSSSFLCLSAKDV